MIKILPEIKLRSLMSNFVYIVLHKTQINRIIINMVDYRGELNQVPYRWNNEK